MQSKCLQRVEKNVRYVYYQDSKGSGLTDLLRGWKPEGNNNPREGEGLKGATVGEKRGTLAQALKTNCYSLSVCEIVSSIGYYSHGNHEKKMYKKPPRKTQVKGVVILHDWSLPL